MKLMMQCTLIIPLFAKLKCPANVHYIQTTQTFCLLNSYTVYMEISVNWTTYVPRATLGSDLNYKMNAYICHYNIKVVTSPTTVIW